jgi:uncharacterized protein (UPF0332 family)
MPPKPPADSLTKAQAYVRGAVTLLRAGLWEPATQDAYYACLHATLALLATAGTGAETHRGARQLLALHFARPGLVPEGLPRLLGQITADRELATYGVANEVGETAARETAKRASEFLEHVLPAVAARDPAAGPAAEALLALLPDLAAGAGAGP